MNDRERLESIKDVVAHWTHPKASLHPDDQKFLLDYIRDLKEINFCPDCSRVLQEEIKPSLGDHYAECRHYQEGTDSKDLRGWIKMREVPTKWGHYG